MIGTVKCVYETPCGWCTKWDKQCNEKPPEPQEDKEYIPTLYGKCFSCDFLLTKQRCEGCNPDNKFTHYRSRR